MSGQSIIFPGGNTIRGTCVSASQIALHWLYRVGNFISDLFTFILVLFFTEEDLFSETTFQHKLFYIFSLTNLSNLTHKNFTSSGKSQRMPGNF